ncbi:MAG: cation transporter [Chlamydiales bacterium]|nr:cation transporter [Chlamydiia bacterium]MCP5506676.1 cation transporter [Chlamydiales bacterium]
MKTVKLFIIMMILSTSPIMAEIERVTIRWKPAFCPASCAQGLEKSLSGIREVAEVNVQLEAGQANLRWKPNQKFSYDQINRAMRMIGVSVQEINVSVRGTIEHSSREVELVSLGDNTRFTLLSPIQPTVDQSVARNNPESYQLTESTRERLIAAEKDDRIITIQGPLFEPFRAPPLYLIIQQAQIPPPTEKVKR